MPHSYQDPICWSTWGNRETWELISLLIELNTAGEVRKRIKVWPGPFLILHNRHRLMNTFLGSTPSPQNQWSCIYEAVKQITTEEISCLKHSIHEHPLVWSPPEWNRMLRGFSLCQEIHSFMWGQPQEHNLIGKKPISNGYNMNITNSNPREQKILIRREQGEEPGHI